MARPIRPHRRTTLAAAALTGALLVPTMPLAEEVTLKSADGTVNLVGEFVDFRDDNYIIRTELGDLRISAARVRCEGAACPEIATAEADVTIVGSDAIALGMLPLLLTGFASSMDAEAELTNTAVAGQTIAEIVADSGFGDTIGSYLVTASTDEGAFEALLSQEANIGMASRRILPAEAKQLKASGAGNMVSPQQERVVAVDSLVIITHPDNPVGEIGIENLQRIYRGEVRNWSDLGGPDMEIKAVARSPGTTTRDFFDARVFGSGRSGSGADPAIAADDQEMAAIVNDEPGSIGYVGFAFQRGAKPLTLVNECGIPTRPDEFSAKTEEYALGRRMYLYSRADMLDEATKAFMDFAISEEADGVVAKSGFIDLGIVSRAQDLTGPRAMELLNAAADDFEAGVMREMLASMVNSDRLSTTFRFRPGSSRMDEKAMLDLSRLISYLEDLPEGTEVKLVGFTDDVGAFESNRRLSVKRAGEVMDQIGEAAAGRLGAIDFSAIGFGEIAPSACNVTDAGKAINRRVEVWLKRPAG